MLQRRRQQQSPCQNRNHNQNLKHRSQKLQRQFQSS